MASLFTAAWEAGDQSEWGGTFGVDPAVEAASAYNSSSYGMALDDGANTGVKLKDIAVSGDYKWYTRFYMRINTAADGTGGILFYQTGGSGANTAIELELNSDNTLRINNHNGGKSQVGSDSAALTVGQWYRVEVLVDATLSAGSQIIQARLNGTNFANSSSETITSGAMGRLTVGQESGLGANHDFDVDLLEVDDAAYPAPVGESTDTNDERDAETHGQDTAAVERDAEVHGQNSANAERAAETTGVDTDNSERSAEAHGEAQGTNERAAETEGIAGANAERAAETTGVDTANAERDAETTGQDTAQNERQSEATGQDVQSDERGAETHGEAQENDERAAETTGQDSANAERAAEITGTDTATAERLAEVAGEAIDTSGRAAEVDGTASVTNNRAAEAHGQSATNAERSAQVTGGLAANSERAAQVEGASGSANSERAAQVSGGVTDPYCPQDSPYSKKTGVYSDKTKPYEQYRKRVCD